MQGVNIPGMCVGNRAVKKDETAVGTLIFKSYFRATDFRDLLYAYFADFLDVFPFPPGEDLSGYRFAEWV